MKASASEIGPIRPIYIVKIIITLPQRPSVGVRFLVRPTVAVALTVSVVILMSYARNELAANVTLVVCVCINASLALNGLAASVALAVLILVYVSSTHNLNVCIAVIAFAVGVCINVIFTSCGIICTAGIALMVHIGIDVSAGCLTAGGERKHRAASKSKCENHNQNFLHLVYPFKAVLVLQTVNQPATGS